MFFALPATPNSSYQYGNNLPANNRTKLEINPLQQCIGNLQQNKISIQLIEHFFLL